MATSHVDDGRGRGLRHQRQDRALSPTMHVTLVAAVGHWGIQVPKNRCIKAVCASCISTIAPKEPPLTAGAVHARVHNVGCKAAGAGDLPSLPGWQGIGDDAQQHAMALYEVSVATGASSSMDIDRRAHANPSVAGLLPEGGERLSGAAGHARPHPMEHGFLEGHPLGFHALINSNRLECPWRNPERRRRAGWSHCDSWLARGSWG